MASAQSPQWKRCPKTDVPFNIFVHNSHKAQILETLYHPQTEKMQMALKAIIIFILNPRFFKLTQGPFGS